MDTKSKELKKAPFFLIVNEEQEGQRLDNFLFSKLKGLPKSHIYRIVRKGEVRVNKKRIKPDYRIQAWDQIRIPPLIPSKNEKQIKPNPKKDLTLENHILYEDKKLIIINKPTGMAVHGGSGVSYGVIEILRHSRPHEKFLELAHRLDRETSGCLVITKKPSILKQLHHLLRTNDVDKRYLALVAGHWPKHLKIVDVSLQKNQLRSGERMVKVNPEGKESLTEFRVIKLFASATLVEAKPKTGRTHQIRVHAAFAGHPIACDEKYGNKEFNKIIKKYSCKRLFLHASSIIFTLPDSEQTISVQAPIDHDLELCLKQLN